MDDLITDSDTNMEERAREILATAFEATDFETMPATVRTCPFEHLSQIVQVSIRAIIAALTPAEPGEGTQLRSLIEGQRHSAMLTADIMQNCGPEYCFDAGWDAAVAAIAALIPNVPPAPTEEDKAWPPNLARMFAKGSDGSSAPTEGDVEVTQADRDEAAKLLHWLGLGRTTGHKQHYAAMVKDGYEDKDEAVQTFARHRRAATARSVPTEKDVERVAGSGLGDRISQAEGAARLAAYADGCAVGREAGRKEAAAQQVMSDAEMQRLAFQIADAVAPSEDQYERDVVNMIAYRGAVTALRRTQPAPAQQPVMPEEVREALRADLREIALKSGGQIYAIAQRALERLSSQPDQIPPAKTYEDGIRSCSTRIAAYAAHFRRLSEKGGQDAAKSRIKADTAKKLAGEVLSLLPPDQEGAEAISNGEPMGFCDKCTRYSPLSDGLCPGCRPKPPISSTGS